MNWDERDENNILRISEEDSKCLKNLFSLRHRVQNEYV